MVDKLSKLMIVIIVCFGYFYAKDTYAVYWKMRELRPDFNAPSVWELPKACAWGVFFSATKYLTKSLFYVIVKPYCKDQDN